MSQLVAVVPPERHGLVQLVDDEKFEFDLETTLIERNGDRFEMVGVCVGKPNYRAVAMMVALTGHCDQQLFGTVVIRGLTPSEAFVVVKAVSDAES